VRLFVACTVSVLLAVAIHCVAVGDPAPALAPGAQFTVSFSELPSTLAELLSPTGSKPMMTVFLPRNYDPARKHPLLIFLAGADGGTGGNPRIARSLSEEKDFICVNLPLFKEALPPAVPGSPNAQILMRNPDAAFTWTQYKVMLGKLDGLVPNIDHAHQIMGGFSNGAHTTQGMIDTTDGEFAQRFSAFFIIEGGAGVKRFDLIKGKPLLMMYGGRPNMDWAVQLCQRAVDAGVKATLHVMPGVGHAFPETEYPAVREWLRGPAMGD
jgi:dienelactone hydrolase